MNVRDANVAQPAPTTPSSGRPQWPKINAQFVSAFTTFAVTRTTITVVTWPVA